MCEQPERDKWKRLIELLKECIEDKVKERISNKDSGYCSSCGKRKE